MSTSGQPFTAQVVLRSPDPSQAARVVDEFRRAGFDVGALVADNFSISGSRELFERYFDLPSKSSADRTGAAAEETQPVSFDVDRLPEDVRPLVRDIVTSRIDFGPTNW